MNLIAKKFEELDIAELYEILKARTEIFIMEQNIHYQDMDNVDYKSLHCFFMEENKVIAYLRAFYQEDNNDIVRIGRVLTLRHGNGIGRELMEKSIVVIKEKMKCKKINMDAQKHAVGFYEKFGFQVVSDDFLEEGVVHVVMELEL
ncbi:MAG: GNAT family N-acetyltransferase [Firmicutes bacterium CAG:321_26_22]|nr:MAG: GNAT family N-acetyltransferase [Firmicutes bacterium CAG:321_26_22]